MAEQNNNQGSPDLNMDGSLGALPTENLLQMISNLRLSTRLLLENPKTKEFSILTFREGHLVPNVESSSFPTLEKAMKDDETIDSSALDRISVTETDRPIWEQAVKQGLIPREYLTRYLIKAIRQTLESFKNLSGVHFELSPIATEKLGSDEGYPVDEIFALTRQSGEEPVKTRGSAEPETAEETLAVAEKGEEEQKIAADTSPAEQASQKDELASELFDAVEEKLSTLDASGEKETKDAQPGEKVEEKEEIPVSEPSDQDMTTEHARTEEPAHKEEKITEERVTPTVANRGLDERTVRKVSDLLRQVREAAPGTLAGYLVDGSNRAVLASSSSFMGGQEPDLDHILKAIYEGLKGTGNELASINEIYMLTDVHLVAFHFLADNSGILAICKQNTQLGLLITGLRRARRNLPSLIAGEPG